MTYRTPKKRSRFKFFGEVISELRKVVWLSRREVAYLTFLVVVVAAYTVTGVLRGFVWESAIFCTLVFGLAAGMVLNYPVGMVLRGHEFRYSSILSIDYTPDDMAFSMERGQGIIEKMDGFFKNRVFGTYTHILAQGTPQWTKALVSQACAARSRKIGSISI